MTSVLRAARLAAVAAVVLLAFGLAVGLVVAYWPHVRDWLLIALGLGGIVCLTAWSD
jgi:hypothetical protein